MKYMMADVYDGVEGFQTADSTIPDTEERQVYTTNVVQQDDGTIIPVQHNLIWGTMAMLVGLMVVLKFAK